MIRAFIITTIAMTMLTTCGQAADPKPIQTVQNCLAIDGDTITCAGTKFRLLAIDTAEMPGHCQRERICAQGDPFAQKQALTNMLNDPLEITEITKDRYKRTVAIIINAKGQNLSCEMLKNGAEYKSQYDNEKLIYKACPALIKSAKNK
jgi:micrococcal nuclease